jgi:hypothetical protein
MNPDSEQPLRVLPGLTRINAGESPSAINGLETLLVIPLGRPMKESSHMPP